MKRFIGRESELMTLEREFKKDSGFVVIYGRRRVGKTTLIKEFIKNKDAIYFLATEEMENGNIKRFTQTLAEYMDQDYIKNANFSDWEDVFKVLVSCRPGSKKILVIDEFQYLVNVNPAFTSIFQRIWDERLKDQNVMVIICGSLISMVTTHLLSYSSPLYGRRTAQIRLGPLKFTELRQNIDIPFEQLVEIYAITGGVPKYFDFFDNNEPLMENIEREILRKNGFLYEEPVFLLEKEVKEIVSYFSIIKNIAAGNHKISQLASVLELPAQALSPYLKTLMDLNLVVKRIPVTEKQPEKSRKGLYGIHDHFIEFWFRFVYAYKGELELDNTAYVLEKIRKSFIDRHVSFVYEDICRDILAKLCQDGNIHFIPSKIGSFWNAHIEIDIAAVNEENKSVILGECKYHIQPVDADVLFDLKSKSEKIVELLEYKKLYVLFSKSGFTQRLKDLSAESNDLLLIDKDKVWGRG
jgi:AAA+ ATPase superfamily predicted ATPase